MPSSYIENVPAIVGVMEESNPQTVLDVGPGYGKYGFLFRERLDKFSYQRRIDAVEIWPAYLGKSGAEYLYNDVYYGNFLNMLKIRKYDLILMIDVLEHFSEEDGAKALNKALDLGKEVLISTPLNYPQGPEEGNPYETHLSEWPAVKLSQFGQFTGAWGGTPDSVIGVLTK